MHSGAKWSAIRKAADRCSKNNIGVGHASLVPASLQRRAGPVRKSVLTRSYIIATIDRVGCHRCNSPVMMLSARSTGSRKKPKNIVHKFVDRSRYLWFKFGVHEFLGSGLLGSGGALPSEKCSAGGSTWYYDAMVNHHGMVNHHVQVKHTMSHHGNETSTTDDMIPPNSQMPHPFEAHTKEIWKQAAPFEAHATATEQAHTPHKCSSNPLERLCLPPGGIALGVFWVRAFGIAPLIRPLEEHSRSTAWAVHRSVRYVEDPERPKPVIPTLSWRDKSAQKLDPSENRSHANLPRVILFKKTTLKAVKLAAPLKNSRHRCRETQISVVVVWGNWDFDHFHNIFDAIHEPVRMLSKIARLSNLPKDLFHRWLWRPKCWK